MPQYKYAGNTPMFYPMYPEVGNIEAKPGDVIDFPEDEHGNVTVPFGWYPVEDDKPVTKTKTKAE